MFQSLINFLFQAFQETWRILKENFAWIISFFSVLSAAIVTVIGSLGTLAEFVVNALGQIIATFQGVTPTQVQEAPFMEFLSFANMFLPIEELFSYLFTFSTLVIACATIRMIKAFIPTLT